MKCKRVSGLLSEYISHELNAYEASQVDAHLAECSRCRDELSKLSQAVRALEMPLSRFDPPNMLAEIKRRAAQPNRTLFPVLYKYIMVGAALIALIVLSAMLMPRMAQRQNKVEMADKPKLIVAPPTHAVEKPSAELERAVQESPKHTHRRATVKKSNKHLASAAQKSCSARITIMDPESFEASRQESREQANVVISDSADSTPDRLLPPCDIAYRPFTFYFREPLSHEPQTEEEQYEKP